MMTPEQKDRVIATAQMGMACGLFHPYEWLQNYLLHTMNFLPYSEIPKQEALTIEAFVEFFRDTASCPEEEEELKNLTPEGLFKRIEGYYEWSRQQRERSGSSSSPSSDSTSSTPPSPSTSS